VKGDFGMLVRMHDDGGSVAFGGSAFCRALCIRRTENTKEN
jgi:hypothetical protein